MPIYRIDNQNFSRVPPDVLARAKALAKGATIIKILHPVSDRLAVKVVTRMEGGQHAGAHMLYETRPTGVTISHPGITSREQAERIARGELPFSSAGHVFMSPSQTGKTAALQMMIGEPLDLSMLARDTRERAETVADGRTILGIDTRMDNCLDVKVASRKKGITVIATLHETMSMRDDYYRKQFNRTYSQVVADRMAAKSAQMMSDAILGEPFKVLFPSLHPEMQSYMDAIKAYQDAAFSAARVDVRSRPTPTTSPQEETMTLPAFVPPARPTAPEPTPDTPVVATLKLLLANREEIVSIRKGRVATETQVVQEIEANLAERRSELAYQETVLAAAEAEVRDILNQIDTLTGDQNGATVPHTAP